MASCFSFSFAMSTDGAGQVDTNDLGLQLHGPARHVVVRQPLACQIMPSGVKVNPVMQSPGASSTDVMIQLDGQS
jgi:hypothetical protein